MYNNTTTANQTIYVLLSMDEQVIFAASSHSLLVESMREHVYQQLDINPKNIPENISLIEKHNIGDDTYEFDYLRRDNHLNISIGYIYKIQPIVYYFEPQKFSVFRTTLNS